MRTWLILVAGLSLSASALADRLDLSFNADAFRVEYARPFPRNALEWDVGWLHEQDNGDVIHGSLHLTGQASQGQNPLRGGLGLRIAYTNGDRSKQDGVGVAVGGYFRYPIPRYNRFIIGGHAYIAPSVLSIGELDQYQDFGIRLAYNVMKDADVYVGLRYVEGQYDEARDATFDDGLNIGVALRF